MEHSDPNWQPGDASKSKSAVIVIAVSVFLNFTGFTLILPVIPFLVGRYVAPDEVGLYVGLIVSVFAFCAFCTAPVLGALSDRYGRRPILMLSLLGSAIGYLVFGLGGALWILFAGRVIDGLTAGNISAIYAYVADTFAPADRGRIYGLLGAVGGLGFMLGPVAGGMLGAMSPAAPLFARARREPSGLAVAATQPARTARACDWNQRAACSVRSRVLLFLRRHHAAE
jgi:DHA1 family tetracycline resistance protein-like MFS transporter